MQIENIYLYILLVTLHLYRLVFSSAIKFQIYFGACVCGGGDLKDSGSE